MGHPAYRWSGWSRCARLPCCSRGTRRPHYLSRSVCLSITADSCWTIRALTRRARFSLRTRESRILTKNYKVKLVVGALSLRRSLCVLAGLLLESASAECAKECTYRSLRGNWLVAAPRTSSSKTHRTCKVVSVTKPYRHTRSSMLACKQMTHAPLQTLARCCTGQF